MLNGADNRPLINLRPEALHEPIRAAMEVAAYALIKYLGMEDVDLSTVTTKTNVIAGYAKFILRCTLIQDATFGEDYITNAWEFYQATRGEVTAEKFYALTLGAPYGEFEYKKVYAATFRRGVGIFLLVLHSRGIITLPVQFDWPLVRERAIYRSYEDLGIFSELLKFVRLLEARTAELPHAAFRSVGTTIKRRDWFLSYGTKLLLATGWGVPEDARLEDLLALKKLIGPINVGVAAHVLPYKALIDVLRARYGERFNITVDAWSAALQSAEWGTARRVDASHRRFIQATQVAEDDLLSELVGASPTMGWPEALRQLPRIPGLKVETHTIANSWLDLEETYMRVVKRESYKTIKASLGYFNLYLFFYLAFWFQRHPKSTLKFPTRPDMLVGSVFVARLIDSNEDLPLTFVQFMDKVSGERGWQNTNYYALLKNVEIFFSFLENHSSELPGCNGFRQSIPDYAYPRIARSRGTNKRPIPRRLFGFMLDYIEALRTYLSVVQGGILDGRFDVSLLEARIRRSGNVIDAVSVSSLVGFVPVVFFRGQTIPLRVIPNCLDLAWFPLVDGRRVKIPQPHALNQILVALYTGLRHNHIQWLDVRTFDAAVTPEDRDFTQLRVNTDKSKNGEWMPHVNFRVIDILREQREWRSLIGLEGFARFCKYNKNRQTKWPPILPLFSSSKDGAPHPDARYYKAWYDLIAGLEAILPILGERDLQRLCSLEPPGVEMFDPSGQAKRLEYGDSCKRYCELVVRTSITPHSARSTLVSQLYTLLPAEIIGSHITGQSPGVVYYYVKLDEEQLKSDQSRQAMKLREMAYRNEFEALVKDPGYASRYVRADNVNANFARALRTNLNEALVSYGCISISMNDGATSGLDVIRETGAFNAAENKTEICPYGNTCPPEIVREWKGARRCGLCQYAVRSVDHLQAVSAKVKEFSENLVALTSKIEGALCVDPPPYSDAEFDRLEEERARVAEELTGWRLNEELLDVARLRISKGQDSRRWIVQKPEIIEKDLRRIAAPSNLTAYLLSRLGECIVFPSCEGPEIRARIDLFRRELLARTGKFQEAFARAVPVDPASECAGLLRTLVEANGLGYKDLLAIVEGDGVASNNLPGLPRFLLSGE